MKNQFNNYYALAGCCASLTNTAANPLLPIAPRTLTAVVKDINTGQPIEGVNVYVKANTSIGTATDANGAFTLQVADDAQLVFSHLNYEIDTIKSSEIEGSIFLMPKLESLDEVVIDVPAVTVKKSSLKNIGIGFAAALALLLLTRKKDKDKPVKAQV